MYIDLVLDSKLKGAIIYDHPAETLVKSIFPDNVLPYLPSHLLSYLKTKLKSNSLQYLDQQQMWLNLPHMLDISYKACQKESKLSDFINGIGNAAMDFPIKTINFSLRRCFSGDFSLKPVWHPDSNLEWKLDIISADVDILTDILADLHDGDGLAWPDIKFVIEIKSAFSKSIFKNNVHIDLANKVIAMFDQQPN